MTPGVGDYVLVGVVAAAVTFVMTPMVGWVARRVGWVLPPNERSVHTSPIPHVGGIAMLAGFLGAMVVATATGRFDIVFEDNSEPLGIILAALIVFATGFLDDLFDMAPPGKVTGVVIAGVVLWWFGATMFNFRVPFFDVVILSSDWVPLVTVLWLLGMTQAINLIDGLDGLAAGIVAIGATAFFMYAYKLSSLGLLSGNNVGPLIAIVTAGISLGFLPHNFNPARIFMGDSGAFLLGMLLAVSTSVVGGRADPNTQGFVGQTFFFFAPLAIPLLILGVPILDTLFAIVRRASKRQALDVADKGHLHHRLMNLGHGHRRAVLILWTWTALLSGFVLYPVLTGENPSYLPFGVGALGIVLFTVLHPSVRRKRAMAVEAALERPASEQLDPSRPERREAERLRVRIAPPPTFVADDPGDDPPAADADADAERDVSDDASDDDASADDASDDDGAVTAPDDDASDDASADDASHDDADVAAGARTADAGTDDDAGDGAGDPEAEGGHDDGDPAADARTADADDAGTDDDAGVHGGDVTNDAGGSAHAAVDGVDADDADDGAPVDAAAGAGDESDATGEAATDDGDAIHEDAIDEDAIDEARDRGGDRADDDGGETSSWKLAREGASD